MVETVHLILGCQVIIQSEFPLWIGYYQINIICCIVYKHAHLSELLKKLSVSVCVYAHAYIKHLSITVLKDKSDLFERVPHIYNIYSSSNTSSPSIHTYILMRSSPWPNKGKGKNPGLMYRYFWKICWHHWKDTIVILYF